MYKTIQKMYNILNKGKEKILECFYKNRKELYFSEILRETKLTPNTTLKHLNNLKDLIIKCYENILARDNDPKNKAILSNLVNQFLSSPNYPENLKEIVRMVKIP